MLESQLERIFLKKDISKKKGYFDLTLMSHQFWAGKLAKCEKKKGGRSVFGTMSSTSCLEAKNLWLIRVTFLLFRILRESKGSLSLNFSGTAFKVGHTKPN